MTCAPAAVQHGKRKHGPQERNHFEMPLHEEPNTTTPGEGGPGTRERGPLKERSCPAEEAGGLALNPRSHRGISIGGGTRKAQ